MVYGMRKIKNVHHPKDKGESGREQEQDHRARQPGEQLDDEEIKINRHRATASRTRPAAAYARAFCSARTSSHVGTQTSCAATVIIVARS